MLIRFFFILAPNTDIPGSLGTPNCRIKNALKHLVDEKIKCVQTLDEHDQFLVDFQTKLRSVKILKLRKPLDTPAMIMVNLCKWAAWSNETEICMKIDIYHCRDAISLRTCKQDSNATSMNSPEFGENFISNELSIQIHHNFTHILNTTVFFVYHELNGDTQSAHIVQTMAVEYLELNETFSTRDVHQVSGNIGYLHHKPIIVTKIIHQNETMPDSMGQIDGILAYFHNETNCTNDDHYIKLPAVEDNGNCLIDGNNIYQRIDFGENLRIVCNVALNTIDFNETDSNANQQPNPEQNNTYMCRTFQKKIIEYLLPHFVLENLNSTIYNQFNLRISEMGNPKNDSKYWHDFKTVRPPNLDEIVAAGETNGASEFTCMNMVLGVRYEFFYGNTLVGKISNQPLLKVAQIQFGSRVNLKFKHDEDELKVPIYIDVMFYDFSRVVGNGAQTAIQSHIQNLLMLIFIVKIIVSLA